jgi:acyl-CoA thioesterase FadM
MERKVFIFEKTVYLTDTNAEGNTYFSRYFDWQGMAREEFVRTNVPGLVAILQLGVKMITVEAYLHFIQETFLYDEILIDVKTSNIKKASLDLIFTYTSKKTNQLIAKGRQKLAFADAAGKLIPIPEEIRKNAMYFLVKENTTQGAEK